MLTQIGQQVFVSFNNAVITARIAQKEYGLKRILIFDWDAHLGDGTMDATYEDDEIMYMSIHRNDYGKYFPQDVDGSPERIGKGKGEGYNVLVAWNNKDRDAKSDIGDTEYKYVC